MNFKRLQKKVDKGIAVLSDNDDKKHEDRYKNLQNIIQEAQDFIDNGVYSAELDKELHEELKVSIKEFEESKWIFIIFLIILTGLLFIGVFYITYSHFYDHFHPATPIKPPYSTEKTTQSTLTTDRSTSTEKPSSTKTTSKSTTTITTQYTTSSDKTTAKTTSKSTSHTTSKKTSKSTTKTTSKITSNTTTSKPIVDPDDGEVGFVTVMFDTSSLIDLDNIYPMLDSDGLNTKPTTWKLSSTLSKGSKDYVVQYTINFIDQITEIDASQLLKVSDLKFQLLVKNNGVVQYDSGVQYLDDYQEVDDGLGNYYRPIITLNTSGNTFKNNETLDFELRMWLDSQVGNTEQGKKYKFNISVEAAYEFIE